MRRILTILTTAGLCAGLTAPAHATDDDFEFWLNPSVSTDLDDDTAVEFETAQRFRDSANGRADTYFFRGWVKQKISDEFTLAGAVDQRINDGGNNEFRTMQQLSGRHGIFRTRARLEQRFVNNTDRMGLRFRPRLGVAIPLDEEGRWAAEADAELFVTLRSTRVGGDEGLTGLRTQVGVSYELTDNLSLGLVYLRQQDFEDGAPDEVGHAPLIVLELDV